MIEQQYWLDDDDRERLRNGGELTPAEAVIVETFLHRLYRWVVGPGGYRLRWVRDAIWIEGAPTPEWTGRSIYDGYKVRRFLLGLFSEEEASSTPLAGFLPNRETWEWLRTI